MDGAPTAFATLVMGLVLLLSPGPKQLLGKYLSQSQDEADAVYEIHLIPLLND